MEIALAAGASALFSAATAAVNDNPELQKQINSKLASLRSLMPYAEPLPHDILLKALGTLPVAFDADKRSLDGSRPVGREYRDRRKRRRLRWHAHRSLAHAASRGLGRWRWATRARAEAAAARLRSGDVGPRPSRALHHPEAAASSRLTELALASNGHTPSIASRLADALRELPALLSLDLSYNPLGADGCVSIGEALSERRVLQALSLASCALDDAGVTRLAASLKDVPLGELDLDGNSASDAAVGALLGMSNHGMPLAALRLSANAIGQPGACALAAHLAARPGGPLRSLHSRTIR